MEPKREPKWSPKASQDRAKKEKKSEVKLSRVLGAKKRMEQKCPKFSRDRWGREGRPKNVPVPLQKVDP